MSTLSRLIQSLFVIVLFTCTSVQAGSERNQKPIFAAEDIAKFGKKVERELAKNGARVAILSRVGRERKKLPEGVLYTHTAIAVYSQITKADGTVHPGYAIYNLYQTVEDKSKSELVVDYPIDFFAGAKMLETGVVIPTPKLQKRILSVINSETYQALHVADYSVIANPFNLQKQNCTEFTLDIITAAIYQTDNVKQIKANQFAYFKPQPVEASGWKLMLGSMFVDDISTSDHKGKPYTATFSTIQTFLEQYNAVQSAFTVKA